MHQLVEMPACVRHLELDYGAGVGREAALTNAHDGQRVLEARVRNKDGKLAFDQADFLAVFMGAQPVGELHHKIAANLHVGPVVARLAGDHVVVEMQIAAGLRQARDRPVRTLRRRWIPQVVLNPAIDLGIGQRDLFGVQVNRVLLHDVLGSGVQKVFLRAPRAHQRQDRHPANRGPASRQP